MENKRETLRLKLSKSESSKLSPKLENLKRRVSTGRTSIEEQVLESKGKCKVCKREVRSKALQCDGCDQWVHVKCGRVSANEQIIFDDQKLNHPWFCSSCREKHWKKRMEANLTKEHLTNENEKLKNNYEASLIEQQMLIQENEKLKEEIKELKRHEVKEKIGNSTTKTLTEDMIEMHCQRCNMCTDKALTINSSGDPLCEKCLKVEKLSEELDKVKKSMTERQTQLMLKQIRIDESEKVNERLRTEIATLEMWIEQNQLGKPTGKYITIKKLDKNDISEKQIEVPVNKEKSQDAGKTNTNSGEEKEKIKVQVGHKQPTSNTEKESSVGKKDDNKNRTKNRNHKTQTQKKSSPKKSVNNKQDLQVKQCLNSQNDNEDRTMGTTKPKPLEKTAEKDHRAVLIIGDSIVRDQDKYFVDLKPRHRKRICMPGATLATIHSKCIEELEKTGNDTVHIINGGNNDIKHIKPSIIIDKMKQIIDLYKVKERTLCVTEILPRDSDPEKWQDETYVINQKLKQLCLEKKVLFIETYFEFYGNSDLYKKDGVHLNKNGSKELGSILNRAVETMGN